MGDTLITLLIIGGCLVFIAMKTIRSLQGKSGCGCGCSGGCADKLNSCADSTDQTINECHKLSKK